MAAGMESECVKGSQKKISEGDTWGWLRVVGGSKRAWASRKCSAESADLSPGYT